MRSPGPSSSVSVREAGWLDRELLYHIDVRCFDDVWEKELWLHWFKEDRVVYVAEADDQIVGFAACIILSDGVAIEKIGVRPDFRLRGVSKDLLLTAHLRSQLQEWSHVLSITIPETFLCPGQPDDISGWVKAVRFRAKVPLQPDYFNINGDSIDGVSCLMEE
jgi:GNAT superfamily N-acetyltransferase